MNDLQIGEMHVYAAEPDQAPKAAIIVIQEIFGVNQGIKQKCMNWARDGYLAVAPDLFWRIKPGIDLDPDVPEQLEEAFGYFRRFGEQNGSDTAIVDIEALIKRLHQQGISKVGCVGYCLGGRLAYLAACRTDISASVGYYGVMIDQLLDESHAIANPLMLHIATADHFVGPDEQAAVHAGLDEHPKVTLHDYQGLDHGFAAETGSRRDDAGAKLADSRTAAFFAEHLC